MSMQFTISKLTEELQAAKKRPAISSAGSCTCKHCPNLLSGKNQAARKPNRGLVHALKEKILQQKKKIALQKDQKEAALRRYQDLIQGLSASNDS